MLIESKDGCNHPNVHKTARSEDKDLGKYYSCAAIINLFEYTAEPTQGAIAYTLGKMGLKVFPCHENKRPIVDHSMGFVRGFLDATTDTKKIIRTWKIYEDAAIGLALPQWLIVIDLDVRKDAHKRPVLNEEGLPDFIGLGSFQKLILELFLDLNNPGGALDTLMVTTQSGGLQIYYRLPEGYISFNHTAVLPGVDIKGFGGYVICPNSRGLYGKYAFKNLTNIRPIPEALLKWIFEHKDTEKTGKTILRKRQQVDDKRIADLIDELAPVWVKASGERWKLGKAICGTLYRQGWSFEMANEVMDRLCDMIPNGREHRQIAKWVYGKMKENYKIEGFPKLKEYIEKYGGNEQ